MFMVEWYCDGDGQGGLLHVCASIEEAQALADLEEELPHCTCGNFLEGVAVRDASSSRGVCGQLGGHSVKSWSSCDCVRRFFPTRRR